MAGGKYHHESRGSHFLNRGTNCIYGIPIRPRTRETQWDRKHCTVFLDCYFQNGTGPTSNPDATCGVNKFPYGMAPKTIADQVYQCLGCPGSTPLTSCANAPGKALRAM